MKKLIPLALVALLGSTSLALAQDAFPTPSVQARDNQIELGTISTTGAGEVQVYDFQGGMLGQMLGSTPLVSGANADVKVSLPNPAQGDALAVLVVDGRAVASQVVQFEASGG